MNDLADERRREYSAIKQRCSSLIAALALSRDKELAYSSVVVPELEKLNQVSEVDVELTSSISNSI